MSIHRLGDTRILEKVAPEALPDIIRVADGLRENALGALMKQTRTGAAHQLKETESSPDWKAEDEKAQLFIKEQLFPYFRSDLKKLGLELSDEELSQLIYQFTRMRGGVSAESPVIKSPRIKCDYSIRIQKDSMYKETVHTDYIQNIDSKKLIPQNKDVSGTFFSSTKDDKLTFEQPFSSIDVHNIEIDLTNLSPSELPSIVVAMKEFRDLVCRYISTSQTRDSYDRGNASVDFTVKQDDSTSKFFKNPYSSLTSLISNKNSSLYPSIKQKGDSRPNYFVDLSGSGRSPMINRYQTIRGRNHGNEFTALAEIGAEKSDIGLMKIGIRGAMKLSELEKQ